MSLAQQIGQLFMVGTPATGADGTALASITSRHIGNIMLTGRSTAGTAGAARVVTEFRSKVSSASTSSVPLLVATDQEGGYVQVLHGTGFDTMQTALTQGGWSSSTIAAHGARWATELRRAGVNMNLAPVADTVPSGWYNPPIGYYQREYGHTTATVSRAVNAILAGEEAQGHVAVTGKHFPGLGLVPANTDTSVNVQDNWITKSSPYINPYKQLIRDNVPVMMMSSARYNKIDRSRLAVFSPTILQWLRSLGFHGVIMTDDFGQAKAITTYSYATRANTAFHAGVDLILTVRPSAVGPMYDAVLASAKGSPTYAATLRSAALRVLTMKARFGLMPTC
jgi:beta-N-acetylhexosaminidase